MQLKTRIFSGGSGIQITFTPLDTEGKCDVCGKAFKPLSKFAVTNSSDKKVELYHNIISTRYTMEPNTAINTCGSCLPSIGNLNKDKWAEQIGL